MRPRMKLMKPILLALAAATILTLTGGVDAVAEDSKTLNGGFVWNQRDNSGDLEAVFKPTGEGTWNVDFHFTFRGKDHTYSGTAEGSLSEGNLKGTVKNESGKRTFKFQGEFKDGKFEGTHTEIEGEREVATGTLSLAG